MRFKLSSKKRSAVIGLICGVCCALCVGLYVISVDNEAEAAQAEMLARYGGEQVDVCVARRDITAGETIADSDIEIVKWIASFLPAEAVTVRGDAIGKQVGSTILAGEVISSKRFGFNSADIEVPDGYSAISVPAKRIQAVGGALKPGMRTDIYSVGSTTTSKIASSVLVLATSNSEDSASSSSNAWVTVALPSSRIEEMVNAAQNLELYFVLPSEEPEDDDVEFADSSENVVKSLNASTNKSNDAKVDAFKDSSTNTVSNLVGNSSSNTF